MRPQHETWRRVLRWGCLLSLLGGLAWITVADPGGDPLIPCAALAFSAVMLAANLLLWTMARPSFHPDQCQACGYNLKGNISGVCPECGTKAHVMQTEAEARTAYEKAVTRSAELRESALFCLACVSTGASALLLIRSILLGRAIDDGLRDQTPLWILVPLLWLAYADQRRRSRAG